jgi:signal transduction histidine kinase
VTARRNNDVASEGKEEEPIEQRQTGIGVVGQMTWGSHLCHFYETKSDLLDLVLPFLKAGLEQGEACLWVISDMLTKEEAMRELRRVVPGLREHLARGTLEILTHNEWYLKEGMFDLDAVISRCTTKLNRALEQGLAGLRLTGDGSWIREHEQERFREFEKDLGRLIANQRFLVLCTYPLAQSRAAKVLEVARFHQVALAKRKGRLDVLEVRGSEEERAQMERRLNEEREKLGVREASLFRDRGGSTLPEELLVEQVHFCALGEKIARWLTQSRELDSALQNCAEALVEHLNAAFARIWILNESTGVLELRASAGLYTRLNGTYSRIPVGKFKVGRIAQTRRPHLTNDVENDPEIDNPDWARMTGMISFAGYPLIVEDELLGVIGIFARRILSDFTLKTIAFNAGAIALAIRRSRAEEALCKSERKLVQADEEFELTVQKRAADLRYALAEVRHFSPNPDESARFAQQIQSSVGQTEQLIRDALEYNRVSRQELSIAPVNPKNLLQGIIDSSPDFQPPRALIRVQDPIPLVLGSYSGLRQVFSKLLANAVKFVEAGQLPEVSIFAELRGEFVRIWFEDNGIGIASEFQPSLFHIFQRGSDKFPGSGLGLAMAKSVIERMDGEIGVESVPNQGSRFWIEARSAGEIGNGPSKHGTEKS